MDAAEFAIRYPRLWHMAHKDSWSSIEKHGLLSTSALLDLFEVVGEERERIESRHRPTSITVSKPGLGTAVVRDQKPMSDGLLERCLTDGLTPRDWYENLNGRVFFWVSEDRLERMIGAGAYRSDEHLVLELDTARLLDRHLAAVALSPINSGATFHMGPAPRGLTTFSRFDDYPWETRSKRAEAVVELAVDNAVPDVADFVVARSLRRADG